MGKLTFGIQINTIINFFMLKITCPAGCILADLMEAFSELRVFLFHNSRFCQVTIKLALYKLSSQVHN